MKPKDLAQLWGVPIKTIYAHCASRGIGINSLTSDYKYKHNKRYYESKRYFELIYFMLLESKFKSVSDMTAYITLECGGSFAGWYKLISETAWSANGYYFKGTNKKVLKFNRIMTRYIVKNNVSTFSSIRELFK